MQNARALTPIFLAFVALAVGCSGGEIHPTPSVGPPGRIPMVSVSMAPTTACGASVTPDPSDGLKRAAFGCFIVGNSASPSLSVRYVRMWSPPPWPSVTCTGGTFSINYAAGGVEPSPMLPSPTASFNPSTTQGGSGPNGTTACDTVDSTSVMFSFPSPIPSGHWTVNYHITETYTVCNSVGQGCTPNTSDLGDLYIHPGLRITDSDQNGAELQNTLWSRVVGQGVYLNAGVPWDDDSLSGCNWGVPYTYTNYVVGSYGSYSGSTPPTVMLSPSPMPAVSNTSSVHFFWFKSFNSAQLNVTCMVSNPSGFEDGGPLAPVQLVAVTNVHTVSPTFTLSDTFAPLNLGPFQAAPNNETQISLGTELNLPSSAGLQSTYKITAPAGYGGNFAPNQTVEWLRSVTPTTLATPETSNGQYELDGCATYTLMPSSVNIRCRVFPREHPRLLVRSSTHQTQV